MACHISVHDRPIFVTPICHCPSSRCRTNFSLSSANFSLRYKTTQFPQLGENTFGHGQYSRYCRRKYRHSHAHPTATNHYLHAYSRQRNGDSFRTAANSKPDRRPDKENSFTNGWERIRQSKYGYAYSARYHCLSFETSPIIMALYHWNYCFYHELWYSGNYLVSATAIGCFVTFGLVGVQSATKWSFAQQSFALDSAYFVAKTKLA